MRNFQTLDHVLVDTATGIISFTAQDASDSQPTLSMRREGDYASISASYGALEIALRLRFGELRRTIHSLQPNDGLNTTRQVGMGDSYLGLGLRTNGSLVVRPTIIGDASGYFCLNLVLASDAVRTFVDWLGADEPSR